MPRLARGKFGRLLFGPLLGGRKLRLERIDMGFERSDDMIRQRSFIRIPKALRTAVNPNDVVPTLWRPNSRSLVVSERLLPSAALGALPNRLGRDAQQVRRLPVGKPLARQNCPPSVRDVGRLCPAMPQRSKEFYLTLVAALKTKRPDR
jgi:hypothetical protein